MTGLSRCIVGSMTHDTKHTARYWLLLTPSAYSDTLSCKYTVLHLSVDIYSNLAFNILYFPFSCYTLNLCTLFSVSNVSGPYIKMHSSDLVCQNAEVIGLAPPSHLGPWHTAVHSYWPGTTQSPGSLAHSCT